MTPREPEAVNRKLKRWLWQEEQRWKQARHADVTSIAVKAARDRDRVTTADRAAGKAFAAAANAGTASITMTKASARQARHMLELDWSDVEKLSGILASSVMRIESGGPSTVPERKMLQAFYEREGLAFARDGGVAWAE